MGRVSLFFSTRRGLEGPLFRELQGLPCLTNSPAVASVSSAVTTGPGAPVGDTSHGPQQDGGPQLVMSPGGVLLQRAPLGLLQQLCCNVRTAECVWLRLWGPTRCNTADHLQTAIGKLPWYKYVRPLSALPLIYLRVVSIESAVSDSPSLRAALTRALEEAAAAAGPASETEGAADPVAAAAERTLAAATHRLRIVCFRGQALADLQLSSSLDPRPYRYLSHLPAGAAAETAAAEKSPGAPSAGTAAEELRLAAAIAELQHRALAHNAGLDPSWSLSSLVASTGRGGRSGGPLNDPAERAVPPLEEALQLDADEAPSSSNGSRFPPETNSTFNLPGTDEKHPEAPPPEVLGPSLVSPGVPRLIPRSAATVSMLRLLYLRDGGAREALAGAMAAEAEASAAAAGDGTAATTASVIETTETPLSLPLWGTKRYDAEEGDVSLAAAAAAAGLRRILRREKRLVLWDPFCSNGSLLLEVAMLLGGLPPSVPSVPSARDVIPAVSLQPEEQHQLLQQEALDPAAAAAVGAHASVRTPQITLVGTDERPLLLHAARQRLRNFCHFYYGGREPMDLETQQEELQLQQTKQQLHGQLSPPFAMGLHLASPFKVSPFVSGGLIFTRIPCPTEAKRLRSARGKTFDFYEKLGHMIASRSDWRGVFVIVKGTSFLHYSRLEWETLLKWRDVSGRKLSLQRWTGRKHALQRTETHRQRLAALDAQDLKMLPFMDD